MRTTSSQTLNPLADASAFGWLLGWLLPCFFLSILTGAILLREAGSVVGNEMTGDRAIFNSVSALTLTGFDGAGIDTLRPVGRVVVFALTVFGTFFALFVGGVLLARVLALPRSAASIGWATLVLMGASLFVGTPCLLSRDVGIVEAMQLSLGALGNSGIEWSVVPAVTSWQTHLIILPLAVMGAVGVVPLMEAWDWVRRRKAMTTPIEEILEGWGISYVVSLVLVFVIFVVSRRVDWTDALASASVMSINTRSLGMTFEMPSSWPLVMPWVAMLLMFVGGAPGSAAGGIGVTTPGLFVVEIRRLLRGEMPDRVFAISLASLFGFIGTIFLATLALVASAPQGNGDRLLFLAVSALTTTGLSHDPLSLVGVPLHILTICMLLGRLMPLAVLWWLASKPSR